MDRELLNAYVARIDSAFLKTMRKINSELSDCQDLHLPPAQFLVLRLLAKHGNMTVSELADLLNVKPSAITSIVDRMARNGWLSRKRIEEDRRVVFVLATKSGLETLRQAEAIRQTIIEKYLSLLDKEELEQLVRIYEKLAALINSTDGLQQERNAE